MDEWSSEVDEWSSEVDEWSSEVDEWSSEVNEWSSEVNERVFKPMTLTYSSPCFPCSPCLSTAHPYAFLKSFRL